MSSGRFLGGLLVGGAIGTVIGLLIAPRSGEETRNMIRDELGERANRSLDTVKYQAQALKERARESAEQLRDRSQQLVGELEETGKETWDKLRSTVKAGKNHPEESA